MTTAPITARLRAMKVERRDSTGIGHWETHPTAAEAADLIDDMLSFLKPLLASTKSDIEGAKDMNLPELLADLEKLAAEIEAVVAQAEGR